MAEDELERGANPEVLALAQAIIESQTAEIETMRDPARSDLSRNTTRRPRG